MRARKKTLGIKAYFIAILVILQYRWKVWCANFQGLPGGNIEHLYDLFNMRMNALGFERRMFNGEPPKELE